MDANANVSNADVIVGQALEADISLKKDVAPSVEDIPSEGIVAALDNSVESSKPEADSDEADVTAPITDGGAIVDPEESLGSKPVDDGETEVVGTEVEEISERPIDLAAGGDGVVAELNVVKEAISIAEKLESSFEKPSGKGDGKGVDSEIMITEPAVVDILASAGANKKSFSSPSVIDNIDLELTNEDSPRLVFGETLATDLNVNEVFSHEHMRISHSSGEVAVAAPAATQEPVLDLKQAVINDDILNEGKEADKSQTDDAVDTDEIFGEAGVGLTKGGQK